MFVGGVTRRGGRKHCEDLIATQSNEGKQIFLAVFDGHGGIEAAKHAQENLWESIKRSEGFGSDDPHDMVDAIRDGFKKTQEDMWKVSQTWKKKKDGSPNMSGTTVACAIFQRDHMYVANVGDSTIILAKASPGLSNELRRMTRNHKPRNVSERIRIEILGGSVIPYKGALRVVHKESPEVDKLPKLNMTRSLGDLWSITKHGNYLICPVPHVSIHHFDFTQDEFIVMGSDGLFNVVTPQMSVKIVQESCKGDIKNAAEACKAAEELVTYALQEWDRKKLRADNVTAVVGFINGHTFKQAMRGPCKDQLDIQLLQDPILSCDEN